MSMHAGAAERHEPSEEALGLGDFLAGLARLQSEHLERPCHPTFMPGYIRMAMDVLERIHGCLQHDLSMADAQRADLIELIRVWCTDLLPDYIDSCIRSMRMDGRFGVVSLAAPAWDAAMGNLEEHLRIVHTELEGQLLRLCAAAHPPSSSNS